MNLTKRQIAEDVPVLYKKEAIKFIDLIFETIAEALEKGETVKIAHLGKFEIHKTKPRVVTNFKGARYDIPSRKVVKFRPVKAFVDRLSAEEEL